MLIESCRVRYRMTPSTYSTLHNSNSIIDTLIKPCVVWVGHKVDNGGIKPLFNPNHLGEYEGSGKKLSSKHIRQTSFCISSLLVPRDRMPMKVSPLEIATKRTMLCTYV